MFNHGLGDMAWMDLSVTNAIEIKNFYQTILGWNSEAVEMENDGEAYQDFVMSSNPVEKSSPHNSTDKAEAEEPDTKETPPSFITGICHAKGTNTDMPAVWLPYFLVSDIDIAIKKVKENKGKLVTAIKVMGSDKYLVIEDPAGAKCALYQKG